jgi:hypothetical protein
MRSGRAAGYNWMGMLSKPKLIEPFQTAAIYFPPAQMVVCTRVARNTVKPSLIWI